MLDHLVNDTFRALIIIDEAIDELYKVVKNFRFPVEVIEVVTYQGSEGDYIHRFTPLFKDVSDVKESIEQREQRPVDIAEFDTIVVPAQENGFQETFLGGNRWYAIRIHASMLQCIGWLLFRLLLTGRWLKISSPGRTPENLLSILRSQPRK